MMPRFCNSKSGFTLVEMLVAVSLFLVAATIGLGALIVVNDAYRKTKAQQVAIDNVNFAIESMTRSIRTGALYDCEGDPNPKSRSCSQSPNSQFSHRDVCRRAVIYRLIEDGNGRGSIQTQIIDDKDICDRGGGTGDFVELTSPDVDIDELNFYVIDAEYTEGQPRVVLVIKGVAGRRLKELTPFSVQTTVTARN